MTALKDAFKKAGYKTPEDRLAKAITAALDAHPRAYQRAFNALIESVQNDATIAWLLVPDAIRTALDARLKAAAYVLKREDIQQSESRNQRERVTHADDVPVSPTPSESENHDVLDTQLVDVPISPTPSRASGRGAQTISNTQAGNSAANLPDKPRKTFADSRKPIGILGPAAASMQADREQFMKVTVQGKPLTEVTARAARELAKRRGADWQFLIRATDGIPDDGIIGKYREFAELNALHDMCSREYAA